MLTFNSRGLLVPNLSIQSDVSELEAEFVTRLGSEKRKQLFDNYLVYSTQLKQRVGNSTLLQWIDGSFVTKKMEPSDLDMVTFIDYHIAEKHGKDLENFKYPNSLANFGVDAYLVVVYPRKHSNYPLYIGDRAYWMDAFDKTKRNRNGIKHPKGFIEIAY